MIEAGYFPKIVEPATPAMGVPGVKEICSVSLCISSGPDDWVEKWRHNWLGWFNSPDDAWFVVPEAERHRYRLFAYRLGPTRYRKGEALAAIVPEDVKPVPIGGSFISLGFDAVNRSMESILGFECSPLSCNGMAEEIPANECCLLPTREQAEAAARQFSIDEPEPGEYFVVEVLEHQRA